MELTLSDNILASPETHALLQKCSKATIKKLLKLRTLDIGVPLAVRRLDRETVYVYQPQIEQDITEDDLTPTLLP